jgi:hypothetical protein
MKKRLLRVLVALLVVFGLLQLYPVQRSNPPVTAGLEAPADVDAILRRACYDCHSNETRWPWYAYVAPVSWLVVHDVDEGRRELNFSIWGQYDEAKRISKASSAVEEIEEGHMPLPKYVRMHSEAAVSKAELERLEEWADSVQ